MAGAFKMLFGGGESKSAPAPITPPAPPPTPKPVDPVVVDKTKAEEDKLRRRRGLGDTILAGATLGGSEPSIQRTTLLGG